MTDEEKKEKQKLNNIKNYQANREKILERQKKYREDHKEKIAEKAKVKREEKKEYDKLYRTKNKERDKLYRSKNKERDKQKKHEWYLNNKDTLKDKKREWYLKNKQKVLENKLKLHHEKYRNDTIYKLSVLVRSAIRDSFRKNGYTKKSKTYEILGCSFEEFKTYIESKFEPWMNWDNRGNWNGIPKEINVAWDLDHIIPLSTATCEEDIIRLNHYTNFQPLCSYTNRFIKRDNYENN